MNCGKYDNKLDNPLNDKVEVIKRKLNQKVIFGITILIVIAIGTAIFVYSKSKIIESNIDPTSANASDILTDRVLVWSDEFNGKTLDTSKWRYVFGRRDLDNGTPRQYYPLDPSKNVYIENGNLVLKAIKNNPYPNYNWSAAFVETNNLFEFQYGRIEARIKYSDVPGSYATLWTLGANYDRTQKLVDGKSDENIGVPWPKSGEMDIAEFNSTGSPACNLHYGDNASTHKQIGRTSLGVNGTEWHIYAVEWTPESIKFYVDGVLKRSVNLDDLTYNNYNSFKLPYYLMINSGVAWDNKPSANVNELTTLVDWVRVYAPVGISKIVNANSISLDTNQVNLNVGDTYALCTTFTPDETCDKTLKWTSSDESVAMVYGGKITALKSGTAVITAETKNNKTATCKVTVTAP
ncbi:family 16 glycosylhydrolase [Clostridium pasteurianum]|uniref:Beta-glucanase/beta-glucan synthetase n=1 Tax=Clostridium pasteurianum BC1 TaxID=86416 RepID=R4K0X2_CLOPA|nr:family 16 glycosylhydrolase [Clostridium pasteurianum]AGK95416.1 beta-glucanase/beta-glucan synthetase [Clostridium pasteurianum BC1]AGK97418.1 beta-glucanase/beta-glucan synthetase [Clostridium pasteurianum BC1]